MSQFSVYHCPDNPVIFSDTSERFPPRDEIPSHIIVHRTDARSRFLSETERPHYFIAPMGECGYFGTMSGSDVDNSHCLMYRPVGPSKYELMTLPDDTFPPFEKVCTVMGVQRVWLTDKSVEDYDNWLSENPDTFMEQRRFYIQKTGGDMVAGMAEWLTKVITNNGEKLIANVIVEAPDLNNDTKRAFANGICKVYYSLEFPHDSIVWNIHPDFDVRRPDLKSSIGAA